MPANSLISIHISVSERRLHSLCCLADWKMNDEWSCLPILWDETSHDYFLLFAVFVYKFLNAKTDKILFALRFWICCFYLFHFSISVTLYFLCPLHCVALFAFFNFLLNLTEIQYIRSIFMCNVHTNRQDIINN